MASDVTVRSARPGEAAALTALAVRSKAHWGYDDAFMQMSQASLTVSDADVASGCVLVAERQGLLFGMVKVEPDGELGMMFVDPLCLNRGVGRALFDAAVALARRQGAVALEAWPLSSSEARSADAFVGREQLFTEFGFRCVERPVSARAIMRLDLSPV